MSDGAKLMHRGVEVVLADGEVHRLYFGMRALEAMEEKFKGLKGLANRLSLGINPEDSQAVSLFVDIFASCLLHEGLTRDEAVDLMEFKDIVTYFDKVKEAFNDAMPESRPDDPLSKARRRSSRGVTSTTSPQ